MQLEGSQVTGEVEVSKVGTCVFFGLLNSRQFQETSGEAREGAQLIRQQLDKLLQTHDAAFPKNPLLDDKHVLRLKEGKGKQWKELLQAAPEMLSMKFVKVRGREEYGRCLLRIKSKDPT